MADDTRKVIKKIIPIDMTRILLIFLFITQFIFSEGLINEMLVEYFNSKSLHVATIFACSINDYINLFKQTMENYRHVASGETYLNKNVSFKHAMHTPYFRMGVYLDYTCDFGKQVLLQSSDAYILNSTYTWLIKINSTDVVKDFERLNFGLDSDVLVAEDSNKYDKNRKISSLNLFDLYKVNSTWPLVVTKAGSYSKKNGLNITLKGTAIQRRRNFGNITLRGTIVIIDMNIDYFEKISKSHFVDHTKDRQFDALSRCVYIYYTYLMDIYNFSLEIQATPIFGYPVRKGPIIHNGMIGQLENKEIDVGLTVATMQITSRLDAVHFTVLPVWILKGVFVFCHPSTHGTYKALIIPFSTEVWIFVMCLTLAVGMILTFIKKLSIANPANTDQTLSGNILIAIGALFQQGLINCSTKIPERILLLSTLIIGVITVTYYNSMIVTSLLQPPPKYIRSPKQLLESSFTLAIQNHSYFRNLFEQSPDSMIRAIYDKKITKGPGFLKPIEGMNLVQKTKFAYYSEQPIIYRSIEEKYTNEEICSLQEIPVERPVKMQIPLRRNSPLLKYFNYGILLMKETGIIDETNKKWQTQKPECQKHTVIPSVQLQSVLIAYMIITSGIAGSLLILCGELLFSRYKIDRKLLKIKNKIFYQTRVALKRLFPALY